MSAGYHSPGKMGFLDPPGCLAKACRGATGKFQVVLRMFAGESPVKVAGGFRVTPPNLGAL